MIYRYALRAIILSVLCLFAIDDNSLAESTDEVVPGFHPAVQGDAPLAFTTLVQGAASGGKRARPSLHLVRTDAQRMVLAARLSTLDRSKLNAVDLSTSVVIAAFQGLQPTSGYRIDILAVEANGDVLKVIVKRSSPEPGELVRQGFESPYHLIQVARDIFERHHFTNFRLCDALGDALQDECK